MLNKDLLIKAFIKNFIRKENTERSFLELTNTKKRGKFANRLNHDLESLLIVSLLERVQKEFDSPSEVQKLLEIKDHEMCYIISNYEDFDDKVVEFKEAFENLYSRGIGIYYYKSES